MNIYYTYIYLDPRKPGLYKYKLSEYENAVFEYEPFYIGKGKKNRDKHHLYLRTSSKTHNKHLTSKIRKIIKETGKNPIVLRYLDNIVEKEALDLEIKLISSIGRYDLNTGSLCNHSDGGESNSNKIITNKARTHSGTFKKGMIPWNKNKKLPSISKEQIEKTILKTKGKKRTIDSKLNISIGRGCKPILQYDLNGNFIKEWSYQHECRLAGFTSIEYALKNKNHFGNGFLWFRKNENTFQLKIDKYSPNIHTLNKYKNG